MTRKEKYMELGQLLKEIPEKGKYVTLVARYLDEDGWTSDFTYKGCAVTVYSLEKYLPRAILEKSVEKVFTNNNEHGLNKDGDIVKIEATIVIEY